MEEVFNTKAEAEARKSLREGPAVRAFVFKREFERNSGEVYVLWVCKSALRKSQAE